MYTGAARCFDDVIAVLERHHLGRSVLLHPREAGVAHDLQQPASRVVAAKAADVAQRANERFLHDVLRVVIVARDPASQVEGCAEMRQGEALEAPLLLVRIHA